MSRILSIILVGLLIIPSGILAGSVAVENGRTPTNCQNRETWLRDTATRFTNVDGASHFVDRYSGTSAQLSKMADAYATAATSQLASNPPSSDAESNILIAQYFQWMNENWTGWVNQRYYSTHSDSDLIIQAKQLHNALIASETHCA